jgi:2-polyprenyl-3-methyl-5-hydroxy-6-metoxy-1,4-benzoquinol methylase
VVTTLSHPAASVTIEELPSGKRRIALSPADPSLFIPSRTWETSYPRPLIQTILEVKGPAYLCDEIKRDEAPVYVQSFLKYDILSYFNEAELDGKRILDFGCGSGASTMILARMLPNATFVGVELEGRLLTIARMRAEFYGTANATFFESPDGDHLPDGIGSFDVVMLSAVWEHLLPHERRKVFPLVWSALKPGGVVILDQTPHRYFPVETHTTMLPLINYLPDRLALACARRFAKRVARDESWETLLRRGIRGGTEQEIMRVVREECGEKAILLKPRYLGMRDCVDIWYAANKANGRSTAKQIVYCLLKPLKWVTGVTLTPYLSLALRRPQGH